MPSKEKKRIKPVIEEVVSEEVKPEPEINPETEPVEAVTSEVSTPQEPVEMPHSELEPEPEKQERPKKENKMNLKMVFVITLLSALVAAFVSGGVYVYLSGLESLGDQPENEIILEPSPNTTTTPSPTPEPEEEINISELSVQVLNGSGAIGAASGGEDVLVEAGFSVENTGNASNFDFENTVIQAKSDIPAQVVSQVQKALEDNDYEVEVGDSLPSTSGYDIVVIVGAS